MREHPQDRPGVITRPPVLALGFLVASLGLNAIWRTGPLSASLRYPVALGLIVGGIALGGAALYAFQRAGTNIDPMEPATQLVMTGPYRYTRNPMYISLSLIYLGVGAVLNNLWTLLLLIPLLAALLYGVIMREESYLERTFGDAYLRYKASVRRWV